MRRFNNEVKVVYLYFQKLKGHIPGVDNDSIPVEQVKGVSNRNEITALASLLSNKTSTFYLYMGNLHSYTVLFQGLSDDKHKRWSTCFVSFDIFRRELTFRYLENPSSTPTTTTYFLTKFEHRRLGQCLHNFVRSLGEMEFKLLLNRGNRSYRRKKAKRDAALMDNKQ